MITYGRQEINEDDINAVEAVLRSDWLTQGPAVERFEQEVAHYCGARYAVAVSNATAALHIACMTADLGRDDVLWTSPNTFVASANCALYCDAKPDFIDIDAHTYNVSLLALEAKLTDAARRGCLPKIVIPVHFAGQPCDMAAIGALAKQYGFKVIEDASHAIGGRRGEHVVGSCAYSDMTVLSFHPVKIITTGEGGMVLTNSSELHARLLRLRSHGITRDADLMDQVPDGPWYYQQIELGFNYRMTDMQAALGASQLQRVDQFVAKRHALADRYDHLLADLPMTLPYREPEAYSAFHLYVIRLKLDQCRIGRRELVEQLHTMGIGTQVHYIPVHLQPFYRQRGFRPGDFPESELYYQQALSLPLHTGVTAIDQERIASALRQYL
jgi:UDP-4-amino-4,6-dideoxy-N-acetyl-beta-L-altrosamine transaminase